MRKAICRRISAAALGIVLLLGLAAPGMAEDVSPVEEILADVAVPHVMDSGRFPYDGIEFCRICVPQYVIERFGQSAFAIYPGERDERVGALKKKLNSDSGDALYFRENELVAYSQMRPEVLDVFDDHLAALVKTVYLFCGLEEKEPCIDELTVWLIDHLAEVSKSAANEKDNSPLIEQYRDILHDLESVYKYRMTADHSQGTISRSGKSDGLYYFAQTDPDWADETPVIADGSTIGESGCGYACAAMVVSTYHKVEITPRGMYLYAAQNGWPAGFGLPDRSFSKLVTVSSGHLETERYGTVLHAPTLLEKGSLDMDTLEEQIGSYGYLGILHVNGEAFTGREHYVVLADYQQIDGKGYFLVADPDTRSDRYRDTEQVKMTDTEGLIYVTPEVLLRDCETLLLFEQSRYDFPLYCRAAAPQMLVP